MSKKALIEAALFIANEPVKLSEIAKIMESDEAEAERILDEIRSDLQHEHRGIELFSVGDAYEFKVKGHHVQKVSHLTPYADMGKGLLKVLALVVYKQPITQSDIVKTIGNKAYEYVGELEERRLLRSEKFGRTRLLYVTDEFMSYFGIKDRQDLMKMFEESEPKEEKKVQITGMETLAKINMANN